MTPDLSAILGVLHGNEVRFVIVGGIAVGAHGHARMTLDVDVVPDPERGNIERLVAALTQLEALIPSGKRFDPAIHARALRRGQNATLSTKHGRLDVVQRLEGVPAFADLDADATESTLDGRPIRICSLEHLREMKRVAGRPQDLADLAALPEA